MNALFKRESGWLVPAYVAVFFFSFLITFIFYKQQLSIIESPHHSDARSYAQMAQNIIPGLSEGLRTYGYVLFLKLTAPLTALKVIGFGTMLVQYLLYCASVLLFAFSVTQHAGMRLFITAALLFNLYILAFLPITLTETLSVSCMLLTLAVFFGFKNSRMRLFLLGIGAAFAVEVRPANVWFFVLIGLLLCLEKFDRKSSRQDIIHSVLIFSVGALLAFLPQMIANFIFFHTLTPLPAKGLGHSQFVWGKQMTMVSFALLPEATYAYVVQNPFSLTTPSMSFYWLSIDGFSYGLLKIFAMFTHSALFVYQTLSIKYQKAMLLLSSFTVYFGFLGMVFQKQNMAFFKFRAACLGMFLCMFFSVFTALEDRFTFPLYLLLLPFALYQARELIQQKKYAFFIIYPIFFLIMNMFNSIFEALSPVYLQAVRAGIIT